MSLVITVVVNSYCWPGPNCVTVGGHVAAVSEKLGSSLPFLNFFLNPAKPIKPNTTKSKVLGPRTGAGNQNSNDRNNYKTVASDPSPLFLCEFLIEYRGRPLSQIIHSGTFSFTQEHNRTAHLLVCSIEEHRSACSRWLYFTTPLKSYT